VSDPGGIWYTPTSGIWQSVWLEPADKTRIGDLRIIPDIDRGTLTVTVIEEHCQGPEGCPPIDIAPSLAEVTVLSGGKETDISSGITGSPITLTIPDPILWSPDNPFLYDLKVRLVTGGIVTDEVKSYAGMRKISVGVTEDGFTRIMLNNKFVWQNGPLDQGFWPDGLYTPPSDKAMKYDIEMLKKMGFNMMRKHVKVENRRFYFHTDRLGMLVWQDMPSGDDYIRGDMTDIPKYAGYDIPIVNPVAMIESACMMLDYIDEKETAARIRRAIADVIEEGKVKTYDMMKLSGKQEVISMGAASTVQMTDTIISHLK